MFRSITSTVRIVILSSVLGGFLLSLTFNLWTAPSSPLLAATATGLSLGLFVFAGIRIHSLSIRRLLNDKVGSLIEELSDDDAVSTGEAETRDEFSELLNPLQSFLQEIRDESTQLSNDIEALSSATTQLNSGAESQSASAEESLSTLVMIAAQIDSIAKSAQALAVNVDTSSSSLQTIGAAIEDAAKSTMSLLTDLDEVFLALENIAASIQVVESKARVIDDTTRAASELVGDRGDDLSSEISSVGSGSENIPHLVESLKEMGEDLYLLAINAALDAAHAASGENFTDRGPTPEGGGASRDFVAVAEEAKQLAKRSRTVITDIIAVIEALRSNARGATSLAHRILNKAAAPIVDISDMTAEIYGSSQEQSEVAAQILTKMHQMQTTVRELAGTAKEQENAARDMMKGIEVMNRMTQQVADATREQKQGGDLIVKAIERMAQIAQQVLAASEIITATSEGLHERQLRIMDLLSSGESRSTESSPQPRKSLG